MSGTLLLEHPVMRGGIVTNCDENISRRSVPERSAPRKMKSLPPIEFVLAQLQLPEDLAKSA